MELTSDSNSDSSSSSVLGLGLMQQKKQQHCSSSGDGCWSVGCIIHTVTKFDTLAGVAIKYGVEVGDVKRMNGLSSDLQMFGLKSLQIPLPGRHPPTSPILDLEIQSQNHTRQTTSQIKLSSSPQRNISSSSSITSYYAGLPLTEAFQTNTPLALHTNSKTEANSFSNIYKTPTLPAPNNKGSPASSDKTIEKLLVRRRKSEVDLNNRTPEDFAATTAEPEPNMVPSVVSGVRKSSSAPTFLPLETTNNNTNTNSNTSPPTPSSIWPISLFNFTADLQSMSTIAAIASPLFDGLPKPTSGRKNKAARD